MTGLGSRCTRIRAGRSLALTAAFASPSTAAWFFLFWVRCRLRRGGVYCCRMEPVYISIEEAARLVGRSRSSVKRWLKACRDLIDAGQEPLFAFIDTKDGRHGRVDIHRESFLAFRASEHRSAADAASIAGAVTPGRRAAISGD